MTPESPKGWFVLTIETKRTHIEELAEWVRTELSRQPVEIERAGMPQVWLDVYFETDIEAEIAACAIRGQFPVTAWSIRSLQDRDWQKFWRKHFRRQEVGHRLVIKPAWEEDRPESDRAVISLEPGMSFGTGDHFTTRFCLEMIDRLFEESVPASFLDIGTGSGILAIAAAKLGCPDVTAVEYESLSLESARENVIANGVAGEVHVLEHDITLGWPHGMVGIVCANLFSNLLVQVAPTLMETAGEYLVLSGIMDKEADYVADSYVGLGAREVVRDSDGEWTGLLMRT